MKTTVLVIAAAEGFGELIRQTLEETGRYRVVVVRRPQAVPEALAQHHPQIILLDGDVDPPRAGETLQALQAQAPRARVVFIPPEGFAPDEARDLGAAALLDKPFYLPDLLEQVDRLAQEVEAAPERPETLPGWLANADQAAQHLARLTLESLAVASAMVTRDGRLYAYAGQLPRLAANELAQTVAYYWEAGGQADFARYMTLSAVQGEFMVYVTQVMPDVALALLFESRTPFTRIREQAARLAQALSEIPGASPEAGESEASPAPSAPVDVEEVRQGLPPDEPESGEDALPPEAFKPLFKDVPPPIPEDWAPEAALSPEHRAILDALLQAEETEARAAEAPDVQAAQKGDVLASPSQEPGPLSASATEEEPGLPPPAGEDGEALPAASIRQEASPPSPAAGAEPQEDLSEAPTVAVWVEEEAPADEGASPGLSLDEAPGPSPSEAPTRPVGATELAGSGTSAVEPSSLAPALPPPATMTRADLHYACVLVPRMPHHHITGELARNLNRWVQRIAVAFGWRLVHLAVRPNYLHWVVQVLPNTSPAYAVRVIREHTSHRIFSAFPYLAHDNPSGDFWAPGYLVIGQAHPLPQTVILEFLWEVRQRQGVEK
ncbi:MAG TPA: hypothetical protein G4O04_04525 [Anaerolineae bacterium]|nr:hypothetical protein [Anaerolineae bacterium]HID85436.1 response regulator [Anaerolineales bacterium]HIQ08108.1 response regulator [Anaerolineaceae bacterium]